MAKRPTAMIDYRAEERIGREFQNRGSGTFFVGLPS